MSATTTSVTPRSTTSIEGRDLILTREFDCTPDKLFRAWTEPALITQWFTPPPFTTPKAELDVRPGGSSVITMRGPDGTEFPNRGVFLEVVPNERLVFTDAYTSAWVPSEKPFMTVKLTFDDLGNNRTRYTARVRHWTLADREAHEQMGFHQGWPTATEQLAALVERL
jgi:uncharacterized protein YndB with AHSA1/START domain